jgi:hypothetical protein
VYPYVYEVKLLVNETGKLVDNSNLLVQQKFFHIDIGRAMYRGFCWDLGFIIGSPYFPYLEWNELG